MKRYLIPFTLIAVITLIFGTVYGATQQQLRFGANDPQIQLAEDTAYRLDHGGMLKDDLGVATDPAKSLRPFITIYDKKGTPVATSSTSSPVLPAIPFGVLRSSTGKPYAAVTWQPNANLRLANVTVAAHDYYVSSARSLTEIESRENDLAKLFGLGWLASILVIASAYWLRRQLKFINVP